MKKKKAIAKESIKAAKKKLTEQILSALRLVTINFTKNLKKTDKLITRSLLHTNTFAVKINKIFMLNLKGILNMLVANDSAILF